MNNLTIIILGTVLFSMLAISIAVFFLFHQRQILKEHNKVQELELQLQKKVMSAVFEGQEKERKRLAKDMHDELGAMILALKLSNHQLLKNSHPEDSSRIAENEQLIDNIAAHVRSVSHNLLPPSLKRGQLSEAIDELCTSLDKHGPMDILFNQHTNTIIKKESHRVSIYRVLNEWLTNVIKHSGAKKIEVSIDNIRGHFVLSIKDDGKDFDLKYAMENSKGTGLMSLRGRMNQMGADYSFQRFHYKENLFELYYPLNMITK